MEHVLGRQFLPTSCGNHRIVFDCFYGVSLLQSIQLLLKNHTVQEQVIFNNSLLSHFMSIITHRFFIHIKKPAAPE